MSQERVVERAAAFVRIPSYPNQESELQVRIASGFKDARVPFIVQDRNIVARVEGQRKNSVFIIMTHPDVVDEGDSAEWIDGQPFSGHIQDNKLYGRGSCDMKAGLSAGMEVLIEAQNSIVKPPCDLMFVSAVCEETDGCGAKSFTNWFTEEGLAKQYEKIAIVFPEPTGLTSIMYGHRGHAPMNATIKGEGGHASLADHAKPHPPEDMAGLVYDLKRLRNYWAQSTDYAEFGGMSVTTTRNHTPEGSHNQIADSATASIDIRTVPGYHEFAKEKVTEIAHTHSATVEHLPNTPPAKCDPSSQLIQVLKGIIPDIRVGQFKAASDMGHFLNLLPPTTQPRVQGIIFGPGYLEDAHTTNESVPVAHIVSAADIYKRMYYEWAGT